MSEANFFRLMDVGRGNATLVAGELWPPTTVSAANDAALEAVGYITALGLNTIRGALAAIENLQPIPDPKAENAFNDTFAGAYKQGLATLASRADTTSFIGGKV